MKTLIVIAFSILFVGCCAEKQIEIVEKTVTAPPITIRDTVYLVPPDFVLNPSCDTASILAKYCNPVVEHTDTAGNYWRAQYNWANGRFTEFVKTHPQVVKYIDTTLNVTYQKIDPTFFWKLWFGFQVASGWTLVLVFGGVILAVLSKFKIINLPFGL